MFQIHRQPLYCWSVQMIRKISFVYFPACAHSYFCTKRRRGQLQEYKIKHLANYMVDDQSVFKISAALACSIDWYSNRAIGIVNRLKVIPLMIFLTTGPLPLVLRLDFVFSFGSVYGLSEDGGLCELWLPISTRAISSFIFDANSSLTFSCFSKAFTFAPKVAQWLLPKLTILFCTR